MSPVITTMPTDAHESCFSRCLRDSLQERETGNRGIRGLKVRAGNKKRTKTEQAARWWRQREQSVPSTWNVAGSSQVYFCQLKRLPGALCDTWLLCCLTRKEKREQGEGRRVGLGPFPLSRVCFPPQGWRIFRSRDVMKLWEAYGGEFWIV